MRTMLVALLLAGAALAALPNVAAGQQLPPVPDVTCNPDFAGACYSTGTYGVCAGANFGFQGAGVCVDPEDPMNVRVCTSMRSIFWDGFCPTDGTILDETIAFP